MQLMLAPMDNLTNSSFRSICYKYGAELTYTELVRFESLAKRNKSSLRRTQLFDDTPTMIQIIGKKEQLLDKYLSEFVPEKGFKGFNYNLCCPSHSYIRQGLGCAMINRPTKVNRMIKAVKDYGYNINVKLRLGITKKEKQEKVYLKLIEQVDADFFVVHARYRSESYEKKADWSVFPECVETGKEIVANGDIQTKEDVKKIQAMGCIGIMIGRAAVKNPLIFGQLKNKQLPPIQLVKKEYKKLCKERGEKTRKVF